MKRKRFTEEQIIAALKEAEATGNARAVCRRIGVSEATYYAWKRKFGGMEVSDAQKLRAMEDENRRLKRLVAEQALDLAMLKTALEKKW